MKRSHIKIKSMVSPHLDDSFTYALSGAMRVENLIAVYRRERKLVVEVHGWAPIYASDVLRSAVVLCHAILEQLLRDIVILHAKWPKEFLQRIPLLDQDGIRAEKFTLADIHKHAEMKVNDLIIRSVAKYYEKRSFTSIEDVIEVLSLCSLDHEDYRKYFKPINEMMIRRHHIAHTGDVDLSKGKGKQLTRSINSAKVHSWNKAVLEFILLLSFDLDLKHDKSDYTKKLFAHRKSNAEQPLSPVPVKGKSVR